MMVAVGIKELKARLSEYVRAARAGETVLVTDRGEVVALLAPADTLALSRGTSSVEARLAAAEREGWVERARLPKLGWSWCPRSLELPKGTTDRVLGQLREDPVAQ